MSMGFTRTLTRKSIIPDGARKPNASLVPGSLGDGNLPRSLTGTKTRSPGFTPGWIFERISNSGVRTQEPGARSIGVSDQCSEYSSDSRLLNYELCLLSPNSRGLVARILARKTVALAVLVGTGVCLLIVPALTGQLGANPIERLLHVSGEIAIWTLGAVLSLTPLRVLFPRSAVVNALIRHRRFIGVSACIYGLVHFSCHVLYQGDWHDLLQSFSKPFIWCGLAGLSILVLLALTINNWAVGTFGGKRWKLLHRLTYLAAIVLIYHQSIAGKGHWYVARWLLFLLVALEGARLVKKFWFDRPKLDRAQTKAGEVSQ